jgi:hypothetical protein
MKEVLTLCAVAARTGGTVAAVLLLRLTTVSCLRAILALALALALAMLLLPTPVLACRRAMLRAVLLLTAVATVLLSGRGRAVTVLALGGAGMLAAGLV